MVIRPGSTKNEPGPTSPRICSIEFCIKALLEMRTPVVRIALLACAARGFQLRPPPQTLPTARPAASIDARPGRPRPGATRCGAPDRVELRVVECLPAESTDEFRVVRLGMLWQIHKCRDTLESWMPRTNHLVYPGCHRRRPGACDAALLCGWRHGPGSVDVRGLLPVSAGYTGASAGRYPYRRSPSRLGLEECRRHFCAA